MKTLLTSLLVAIAILTLTSCTKTPMPAPVDPATAAGQHSRQLDTTRRINPSLFPRDTAIIPQVDLN